MMHYQTINSKIISWRYIGKNLIQNSRKVGQIDQLHKNVIATLLGCINLNHRRTIIP